MKKTKNHAPAAMETRLTEERYKTNDPAQMIGKYLAANLTKGWTEDFVDEDTGEVVSIQRHEILESRGKLIDGDIFARIQFHIQSGDVTEVEVSNQKRLAYMGSYTHHWPYSVTAEINGKKHRLLLYAASVHNALEITADYIELNFDGLFEFKGVKIFDYCIFIKDTLKSHDATEEPEVGAADRDFYKVEVEVMHNELAVPYTFVLQTKNVDTAVVIINNWLARKISEENEKRDTKTPTDFTTTVKSGVVIPCFRIIDREFSAAYIEKVK